MTVEKSSAKHKINKPKCVNVGWQNGVKIKEKSFVISFNLNSLWQQNSGLEVDDVLVCREKKICPFDNNKENTYIFFTLRVGAIIQRKSNKKNNNIYTVSVQGEKILGTSIFFPFIFVGLKTTKIDITQKYKTHMAVLAMHCKTFPTIMLNFNQDVY